MKKLLRLISRNLQSKKGRKYLSNEVSSLRQDLLTMLNYCEATLNEVGGKRSQLGQDVFVLLETNFKRGGFFVEFGATDGIKLSNTFVLEKHFGWQGVLSEPANVWHDDLFKNRTAFIETKCVWGTSGETIRFKIAESAELSTASQFQNLDLHAKNRRRSIEVEVETISLVDMLEKYNAPKRIDYLSVDTEGSEYQILEGFDFEKYDIKIITCEHNYTNNRERIYRLLQSKGYERKLESISRFDDWYVKRT